MVALLATNPAVSEDAETLYVEFAEQAVGWYDPPAELGLGPSPQGVLVRALQAGGTSRQAGVDGLMGELGLERPVAEALFEATLQGWKATNLPYTSEATDHYRRAAEDALERAYALAPDHPAIVLSLAAYHDERSSHHPESLDRVLALAADRPASDPLWPGLEFRSGFNSRPEVVRQALDREPGDPRWLESLAQSSLFGYRHGARAAIYGALRSTEAAGASQAEDRVRWLHEEVAALLDTGLWRLALERFESAPAVLREGLLAAPVGRAKPPIGHVRRDLDVRLRLALALALADRSDEADAMLATIPPPEAWLFDHGAMGSEIESRARAVLAAATHEINDAAEDAPDPYDLLLEIVGVGSYDPPQDAVTTSLAARLAEDAGYRALALHLAHRARLLGGSGLDTAIDDRLPKPVLAALEGLRREKGRDREGLTTQVAGLEGATALTLTYRGSIEPIDWSAVLPEWAQPQNHQPAEPTDDDSAQQSFEAMLGLGETSLAHSQRGLGRGALPKGFHPVTQGGAGERRGAIVLGHAFGHRHGHGYWWVESEDGGETWSEPIFTGLLIRRPYQLIPDTWLRPQSDGRWRLGVELWDRRDNGSWFQNGVAELVLDPEALHFDRDGDGLTDLVELRLGLDPDATDSDADGLDDGVDPVPQAALTRIADPEAEALAQALETALENARTPDGELYPTRLPVVLAPGLLDSGRLGAFDPAEPVFFLDPRTHQLDPQRQVGRWVPLMIELFELDRSATRGILLTSRAGRSSQYRLERGEQGWNVEHLAGAIHCGITWGDP